MALELDPRKDLEYLQSLFTTKDGAPPGTYDAAEAEIFQKYGGEDEFINQAKLAMTSEARKNYESKVDINQIVADAETASQNQQEPVTDPNKMNYAEDSAFNVVRDNLVNSVEKTLNDRDQYQGIVDYMVDAGLVDNKRRLALERAFGLEDKTIGERISDLPTKISELFTGGYELGVSPTSENLVFAPKSGADMFAEYLQDPRVQFSMNLIQAAGTPSFESPFARFANAATTTTKQLSDARIADLRYGDKKTTALSSKPVEVPYTVLENDFATKMGYAKGTTGTAVGYFDPNTKGFVFSQFAPDKAKAAADTIASALKSNEIYEELDKRSNAIQDIWNEQYAPSIVGAIKNEPQIDRQFSTLRDNPETLSSFGAKTEKFKPLVNFFKAVLPEDLYNKVNGPDITGLTYAQIEPLKEFDKGTIQKTLGVVKEVYPVSDNDIRMISDSFANYGQSGEFALKALSFEKATTQYAKFLDEGHRLFTSADKDADNRDKYELGTSNYTVTFDGGLSIGDKKYQNANDYAIAYANQKVKDLYGNLDPSELGFSKSKKGTYSEKQGKFISEEDFTPIAYLTTSNYKNNEDLLSSIQKFEANSNSLVFNKDKKPIELVFDNDNNIVSSDIKIFIANMQKFENQLNAITPNLSDTQKQEQFALKYPGYVMNQEDYTFEDQYIDIYNRAMGN